MEHFDCWNDLEKLGIHYLTGEACGLNLRALCDLTETGKATVEAFFRCQLPNDGWNNGKASVMLPRSIFSDLAAFAHVHQTGNPVFVAKDGEVFGMEGDDPADYFRKVEKYHGPGRWVGKSNHPGTGVDNQHAMSGRTV